MIREKPEKVCDKCKLSSTHLVSKCISELPETIILVIGRYTIDVASRNVKKLRTSIYVDEEISFQTICKKDETYHLKSAVCHEGQSAICGHYVSVIHSGTQYIRCDDSRISFVNSDELLQTAYIVVYTKTSHGLPEQFYKMLNCFLHTGGLKKFIKDERFQFISHRKQEICKYLVNNGVTDAIMLVFENDLGSNINNDLSYSDLYYLIIFSLSLVTQPTH